MVCLEITKLIFLIVLLNNIGISYALNVKIMSIILAIELAHGKGWRYLWLESDSQLVNLTFM